MFFFTVAKLNKILHITFYTMLNRFGECGTASTGIRLSFQGIGLAFTVCSEWSYILLWSSGCKSIYSDKAYIPQLFSRLKKVHVCTNLLSSIWLITHIHNNDFLMADLWSIGLNIATHKTTFLSISHNRRISVCVRMCLCMCMHVWW